MCLSPMSLISPLGSMLFGGKKTRATTAGALFGGIPGAMIGASSSSSPNPKPQGS